MKAAYVLSLAAGLAVMGCKSVDESAPTHPRTANILQGSDSLKDSDNADKRATESPKRDIPTGGGAEFPGQSRGVEATPTILASSQATASGEQRVLTLGDFTLPTDTYIRDTDQGNVPHLPEKPGTTYMTGTEPVPDTPWLVDNSWGQVLPLQNAPHRAWPEIQGHYYEAGVKNNPTYYFSLQEHLPMQQNDGSIGGNLISTGIEVPWFLAETVALPVLLVLEPPLAQRSTSAPSYDPNYNGFLTPQGEIVPSPQPGYIGWEYSFLKKSDAPPESQPAGVPMPGLDVPSNDTSLPAIIPVPSTTTPATQP